MKILVDELPLWYGECIFSDYGNYRHPCMLTGYDSIDSSTCSLETGEKCPHLKEIEHDQ